MVFMIGAGMMGLTRFAFHVSKQGQNLAPADRPGAGIIVRSEVLRIWLHPTLIELATRQSQSEVIRTHEDLRRVLELRGQKNLWYAVTIRGHRVDGDFVDILFLRQPYTEPRLFPEFLEILATTVGNSAGATTDDFSTASVHILPEDLVKLELRDAIAELQSDPAALVNPEPRGDSGGPDGPLP